ncbi:MAG: type III-A CRISPR-associated protein Cas10/Csm1, partial [Runella sp.]
MAHTRDIIYLAALLHDIGKFWQRADESYYLRSKDLEKYPHVLKNVDNICPSTQEGYPKYQHVIWTQLFFETHAELFIKLGVYDKNSLDNLTNVSIHHHKPNSRLQSFVQLADWWASGIDRSQANDYHNEVKRGKIKFKEEPLINIFGNLNVANSVKPEEATAFALDSLSILDEVLPSVDKYQKGVSQQQYRILWEKFQEEFKQLPTDSYDVFIASLHYLLKKYTWCIPASTVDFADNSLFDHLKMTAAIAQCLYDYSHENTDAFIYDKKLMLEEGHLPLILVCVDLSGIQKFIYEISSKYAAKSLKGRSFSLQLMLDDVARELVSLTQTTLSHIIYSSGGKFYMLLPNTQKVLHILKEYELQLKKTIWEKYKGNLYLCLGYESFAYDRSTRQIIIAKGKIYLGDLWKRVAEKTSEKKYQKFKELLIDDFESFFSAFGIGGNADICGVTGEEIEKGRRKIDDEVIVSAQIYEQKKIGEDLAMHKFIVHSDVKQPNLSFCTPYNTLDEDFYWVLEELRPVEK